jgi:putative serine protease PepD
MDEQIPVPENEIPTTPVPAPPEAPVAPPVASAPDSAAPAPPAPAPFPPPEYAAAPVPPGPSYDPGYVAAPVETPAQPSRKSAGIGVAIAVSIVVALFVGTLAGAAAGFAGAHLTNGRAILQPAKVTVVPSKTTEPVVAAAAAAVPSVVNIDVSGTVSSSSSDSGLPQGHPSTPSTPISGNGSGVAYQESKDGGTYIITNNHVVENADSIVVRDAAGNRHEATLVGRDPETDIAVVKVTAKIPTIALGDSDSANVGQLVVAIGSPYGLEHSVTSGVISAMGRSLPDFTGSQDGVYPLVNVIQTDAAINPGNSGGALVDRTGKLLGINTAIYSDSGSNGGIGFAIPEKTARRVADQLISGEKVDHPFLGVIGQTVTDAFAKEKSLTVKDGAFVVDLTPGTNAVKAGIQKGDVIIGLGDTTIRSMDDLILAVRRHDVGDNVQIKLVRNGKEMTVTMTVGTKPANLDTSTTTTTTTPTP